jgi:hypothetical protein
MGRPVFPVVGASRVLRHAGLGSTTVTFVGRRHGGDVQATVTADTWTVTTATHQHGDAVLLRSFHKCERIIGTQNYRPPASSTDREANCCSSSSLCTAKWYALFGQCSIGPIA